MNPIGQQLSGDKAHAHVLNANSRPLADIIILNGPQ